MDDMETDIPGTVPSDSHVLSWGCELEFIVAYVVGSDPDPDEGNADLAPILRLPAGLGEWGTTNPKTYIYDDWGTRNPQNYIYEDIIKTLRDAGIAVQSLKGDSKLAVDVKSDTSLIEAPQGTAAANGYQFVGVEVNTAGSWTSSAAFEELRIIMRLLKSRYRIRVNPSCGLHVHVGNGLLPFTTQTVSRLAALAWTLDPLMGTIHPPQRRLQQHCPSVRYYYRCRVFPDGERVLIGKLSPGRLPELPASPPARSRRLPYVPLGTVKAADEELLEETTRLFPEAFYAGVACVPLVHDTEDPNATVDVVWRCLTTENTSDITIRSSPCRANYALGGVYNFVSNADGPGGEFYGPDCRKGGGEKLTIEFREAAGSMDEEWVAAYARICSGIVWFAMNASISDFFAMAMRLAEAQGDFGDPGPTAYDFIDFLDDIGCFAEAELLELRLRNRRDFWFPCRKLDWDDEDWRSHHRIPWDSNTGEQDADGPGDEGNRPVPATGGIAPEGQQPEIGTGDGEMADVQMDGGEQDMSQLSPEGNQPQLTHQPQVPAAPSDGPAEFALQEYKAKFPHGYGIVPTSSDRLLCGLDAIEASFWRQEPFVEPKPSLAALEALLDDPYFQQFNEATGLDDRNNLRADQLAGLLALWGKQHGLKLGLGIVRPDKAPFIYSPPEGDDLVIIWILNDDAQDDSVGIIGHYEALYPKKTSPELSLPPPIPSLEVYSPVDTQFPSLPPQTTPSSVPTTLPLAGQTASPLYCPTALLSEQTPNITAPAVEVPSPIPTLPNPFAIPAAPNPFLPPIAPRDARSQAPSPVAFDRSGEGHPPWSKPSAAFWDKPQLVLPAFPPAAPEEQSSPQPLQFDQSPLPSAGEEQATPQQAPFTHSEEQDMEQFDEPEEQDNEDVVIW